MLNDMRMRQLADKTPVAYARAVKRLAQYLGRSRVTAFVECNLVDTVERGDHSVLIGEVINAGIHKPFDGRADRAVLAMADLGEKVFYGG
jgi:hypothetical protein